MQTNKLKNLTGFAKLSTASIILLVISSCASTYPCGEPSSGSCSSVSSNYERSFTDYTNADDVDKNGSSNSTLSSKNTQTLNFTKYAQVPANGSPLVTQPSLMRVWLTPYTDNDNVYHDQSYEYMITNRGDWLFGNNTPKVNTNLKNISLIQGNGKAASAPSVGFDPHAKPPTAANNVPNNFLNDYPALGALKNQNVPINHTTSPVTGSVVNATE